MTWLSVLPIVGQVIDRLLPDPKVAAEAKLKLTELAQQGELAELDAALKIAIAQAEVNKTEAASPDFFRGGWRPAVGWACTFGLVYTFLLRPLLPWMVAVSGASVPPLPPIDTTELLALLFGLLGLGGMRTLERLKGKA